MWPAVGKHRPPPSSTEALHKERAGFLEVPLKREGPRLSCLRINGGLKRKQSPKWEGMQS